MSLYFWIIILTLAGPLLFSFDKKVAFYKSFIPLFSAIIAIGIPFLMWDIYFTKLKIWGFTPEYLSGIYFYNLPLEECLFFAVVPFACLFIHQVLKAYFPNFKAYKFSHFFAFYFVLSGFILGLIHFDHWYTATACLLSSLLTLGIYFVKKMPWYRHFVFTYLIALIPFLIVNGILTGAFTEHPIVWYNENHIMGFRIYTIPFEDLYYNYNLLLALVFVFEYVKSRLSKF